MRFEKWNALGNDYVILAQRDLPWELTAARARLICAPHAGVGSDGVLLLLEPSQSGFVAALRIFNPDGSEAELSGNGAREAILYLRRNGWTDSDVFSIETAAGEIRPRITSPSTCVVDMGRARHESSGTLTAGGREWAYDAISVGNPQCAIEVPDGLEELDLQAIGPAIEGNTDLFPNRTNVSFWRGDGPGRISARIFERGVGETMSSGTGACGAAVSAVLKGGDTPVTVALEGGELEVEVGEDMHIDLTGWAVPVYAGELSDEFMEELNAAE